jgi:hypothetical protein
MSRTSRFTRTLIAAGVLAVGSRAGAQTFPTATDCTTSLTDPNCFHLKGSDTLFDIMTTAISNARTAGVPGAKNLFYDGSGSGNAETQMQANNGSGAKISGLSLPLAVQSIGPMSRNFRPSIIDASAAGFLAADGNTAGNKGHASWAPGIPNVLGLDAAVVFTKSGACKNINFPTFVDNALTLSPTRRANSNNTGLPTAFADGSAFNNGSATVNYSNLLMVVLSGVDGSGTLAACADARRVQAVQDLAGCVGVNTIDHIYRRDDNSGTTDTFKDRIMVVSDSADPRYPWIGGRFCNGKAIGGIDGSVSKPGVCSNSSTTACNTDADCSGGTCRFNVNNQDFDPIRRPCVAADASHAAVSCTNMLTGAPCQAGDANCTQGLITALSDNDPGSDSITNSIAARVKNDATGQSIGYAGKEAVLAGKGTKGMNMNTTSFSDANVRKENYLLSRRLFLMNAQVTDPLAPPQPDADKPTDGAGPAIGTALGGGATQLQAEQNLFAWMTSTTASPSGRQNVDSIVKQFNFIPCLDDSTQDVSTASNNLCAKTPAAPAAKAKGAYKPDGITGGLTGAPSIDSQGRVWNGSSATQFSTSNGTLCVGGTASGGLCPVSAGRASNSACSQNSDCTSGVCMDGLGLGYTGTAGLLCQ